MKNDNTESLEAVSPTIGNTVLPAVIIVKTRDEAEEQMKLGNSFKLKY